MRRIKAMLLLTLLLVPFAAGAQTDKLAMRVDMQPSFTEGDTISFRVDLYNTSDEEITLDFTSSLQVNYRIGDFDYAANALFMQGLTQVIIPARGVHSWEFEHSPERMKIEPGYHVLTLVLVGYDLIHEYKFIVDQKMRTLPEGLNQAIALSHRSYNPGDTIKFAYSITNTTDTEITIQVNSINPDKYSLSPDYREPEYTETGEIIRYDDSVDSRMPEYVDTMIPAGETLSWDHEIVMNRILTGGNYTLSAGLNGYDDYATAIVMIQDIEVFGTVNGTVGIVPRYDDIIHPVEGATVFLYSFYRTYRDENGKDFAPYPVGEKYTATTDADGHYRFENIKIGLQYTLEVSLPGYYSYMTSFYMDRYEMILNPYLKEEYTEGPVNYIKSMTGPLGVTFGTNKRVYSPGDPLYVFLDIYNNSDELITLEYGESVVTWSVLDESGAVVFSDTSYVLNNQTNMDMSDIYLSTPQEISPLGGAHITYKWHIEELLKDRSGIFTFAASLDYISSSSSGLTPGDVYMTVPFMVADTVSTEITISSRDRKFTAEAKDDVQVMVDADLTGDVDDYLNISELRENHLAEIQNRKFIKMIDINAGEDIVKNLERALVRIYFDGEEYSDPGDLVIAHWIEAENRWEELETNINEELGYAEAYTTSFSWFGLFESGPTSVEDDTPQGFSLSQNSPNPFNPSTVIRFTLRESGNTRLDVFNMAGQKIATLADNYMAAGSHSILFDAGGLSSGVYFYRLSAGDRSETRRMLLMK